MNPFDNIKPFPDSWPESSGVIFHSHLGLGDQIICIGLVNFLTEKYSKVYVPTKPQYFEMMKYCYKENSKVEVFRVSKYEHTGCADFPGVNHLKAKTNLPVIHAGHSNGCHPKYPWPFYTRNGASYDVSFDYFSLPKEGEKDEKIFNHLMGIYNISGDYTLVGAECSDRTFDDLKITSKYPKVYLKVSEDLYSNIFLYQKVIREAKEIHLIDSAYLHLAERIRNKKGMIYYHGERGHRTTLYNPKESIKV
jgi:hypothetical protein